MKKTAPVLKLIVNGMASVANVLTSIAVKKVRSFVCGIKKVNR